MKILGLATMTESAAVLLEDGVVTAAAEEERFSRVKHQSGIPYRAIEWALESRGLQLADLDQVALYWNPYDLAYRARFMAETALTSPGLFVERLRRSFTVLRGPEEGQDAGWLSMFQLEARLRERFGEPLPPVVSYDHHTCHMASCFYPSPFEEAAILVMDGAGESACTTSGFGRGTALDVLDQHRLPHSLGHYYSAITGYLGFGMLDGEYKVMGLCPYGDPSEAATWIRSRFLISPRRGRYELVPGVLDYHRALRGHFPGAFAAHFGPAREPGASLDQAHMDLAAGAQLAFEEVVLDMARALRERTGARNLVIAGGCGLNCVANGKLLAEGGFDQIYVPPVPHDAGGALGAALLAHVRSQGQRPDRIDHAQFGPDIDPAAVQAALAERSDLSSEALEPSALIQRSAETIAAGGIVAWVQGRTEFGPRALGNRSFLADPRRADVREQINVEVKQREPFRPFAPSIKAERADDYFELGQPSPFMTIVTPVRPERRCEIPAVTHVDGTARPQTVAREVNPRYWELLDRFEALTGVPLLLNTSFNIQEPIVCTPREALDTFARSKIAGMALGDHWVTRKASQSS
ncbi:MAG: carbamoyltransferase [Planctomycetes bacterium]|nr:carbamoyltransferase [Planctomycetota bacterium]